MFTVRRLSWWSVREEGGASFPEESSFPSPLKRGVFLFTVRRLSWWSMLEEMSEEERVLSVRAFRLAGARRGDGST